MQGGRRAENKFSQSSKFRGSWLKEKVLPKTDPRNKAF